MNGWTASAPGKLVLLGEYAVLEGAPAVVLAADRRAEARLAARGDGLCTVGAPQLGVAGARVSVAADGALVWHGPASERLGLVDHVWDGLRREGLTPGPGRGFDLELDTSAFFDAGPDGRAKLGLGSSAALTVALASALAAFAGHAAATADPAAWLVRLLRMHGAWQQGRGSGVDVAASVAGGLIVYRAGRNGAAPAWTPLAWPVEGLHCLFIWSGHAVSTADYLKRLDAWRAGHGAGYARHMQALGALAEAAAGALAQARAAEFVGLVARYAEALDAFGAATGLEIFSPEQRRASAIAAAGGAAYKPCGAGGDIGVAFAADAGRLARVERQIVAEGLRGMPLALDPHGFRLHPAPASNGPA